MSDKKITRNKPEMAAKILATAREVMRETDALTMKVHCVARAGGFSTGIIYLHFTNKATLVARVLEAELRAIGPSLTAVESWAWHKPMLARALLLLSIGAFVDDVIPDVAANLKTLMASMLPDHEWTRLLGGVAFMGIAKNLAARSAIVTEVAA